MKNPSTSEEVKTWTTNQVVLATLFVVCVFLTFLLLYRLRMVVFLFFVAIVIGTALRPAVEWLHRRGVSRSAGIIGIYVLLACFMVGFLALVVPLIAEQGTQFSHNIPQYYEGIRQAMLGSGSRLLQNLGLRLPPRLGLLTSETPTPEDMLTQVNVTFFYSNLILRGVLNTLAIFLLAFYWTQERNLAIQTLLRLIPQPRRKDIREFIYTAELKMGGYIRGQGILSLAVGATVFIAYSIIGLPFGLVLAIIAGIMEIVPVFGPILGAIPALLVALSADPQKAIWVLIATVLIQMMENAWLIPRIMNHSLGVNPILILLSLVTFGSVLGFAGAVLAIPFAAILQLVLDRILLSPERANGHIEEEEERLPSIEEVQTQAERFKTMSHANGIFVGLPEPEQREVHTIVEELNSLLRELKPKVDIIEEPG